MFGYSSTVQSNVTGQPPAAAPAAATGTYRPTFGDDGKGAPFNSFLSQLGSTAINNDVSYDTNSKDPTLMRSRVFVGNLVPNSATREELIEACRTFGQVVAATMFKGFAFVQYNTAEDADSAVVGLNGKRWRGNLLDVRLAVNPKTGLSAAAKKRKVDDTYLDETLAANDRNRRLVMHDQSTNEELADTSMADTLICGGCRYVTCDFEAWKQHRIAGCAKPKDLREPEILRCASCEQRFESAWGLIVHLTDFHRMMLYRAETKATETGNGDAPAPDQITKPAEADGGEVAAATA